MEETGPVSDARRNFERFAQHLPADPGDEEYRYLQEYLAQWLEHGDGVAMTGGSYETWLRVAIDIADAVMRHELSLDCTGTPEAGHTDRIVRRVEGIHQPGYSARRYFERAGYEVVAYQREHPTG